MNGPNSPLVSPAELERVRKRHSNIPQDAMFEGGVPAGSSATVKKPKRVRSLAFAPCPECHAPGNRLIGLIPHTEADLKFRDHMRRVGKVSLPCSASGQIWEGDRYTHPQYGDKL